MELLDYELVVMTWIHSWVLEVHLMLCRWCWVLEVAILHCSWSRTYWMCSYFTKRLWRLVRYMDWTWVIENRWYTLCRVLPRLDIHLLVMTWWWFIQMLMCTCYDVKRLDYFSYQRWLIMIVSLFDISDTVLRSYQIPFTSLLLISEITCWWLYVVLQSY